MRRVRLIWPAVDMSLCLAAPWLTFHCISVADNCKLASSYLGAANVSLPFPLKARNPRHNRVGTRPSLVGF